MGTETVILIVSAVSVGGVVVAVTLMALVAYWVTRWF